MSAPTRQLGKLSIGDNMPTTRSEAQRRASAPPIEDAEGATSSEEESSSEEEAASSSATLRGFSSIPYYLHSLPPVSHSRANAGVRGDFLVEQCRVMNDDYEFQIKERGRVRIGQTKTTCSCSEFSGGSACKHIYWLLDRIYPSVVAIPEQQKAVTLYKDGSSSIGPVYSLIDLRKIASTLNWTYVPTDGTLLDSVSESGSGMNRKEIIRDILSAFEEKVLPEDLRADIYDNLPETRQDPQSCVEQLDLQGTIFRLAVSDDGVYESLRKAMPAGARANIFFEKLRQKPRSLLGALDEYARYGRLGPDGSPVEISAIASGLLDYIRDVNANIQSRTPHGNKHAAQPIVELFEDVCVNRDSDVFEPSTWGRREPLTETDEDRNLFHHLMIRSPEFRTLIFEMLDEFPIEILASVRPRLDTIRNKLARSGVTRTYAGQLGDILEKLNHETAGPPEQSSASAQAPGRSGRTTRAMDPAEEPPAEMHPGVAGRGRGAPPAPAPAGQKRRATGAPRGGKKRPR